MLTHWLRQNVRTKRTRLRLVRMLVLEKLEVRQPSVNDLSDAWELGQESSSVEFVQEERSLIQRFIDRCERAEIKS